MSTPTPRLAFTAVALSIAAFASLQSLLIPVLPVIQADLHATASEVTWTITAWLIVAAVATPVLGRIGDLVGKRRIFLVGVAAIVVGSVIAAAAPDLPTLIAGRIVQGLAGAIFPLGFGIIRDEFPREKVPGTIGAASAVLAIGSGLGTVAAGPLADLISWRGLFLVPLVLVAVGGLFALLGIRDGGARAPGRVSPTSAVLLSGWLVALLLPLSMGAQWGWASPLTIGPLVLAAVLITVWVVRETRSRDPLVDMRMMRLPGVLVPNLVTVLSGAAMFGTWAYLPRFLQTPASTGYGLGESVAISGLIMLPMLVTMAAAGFAVGPLARRIPLGVLLAAATLAIGLGALGIAAFHQDAWMPALAGALLGVGLGIGNSATASLVVQSVPATETGIAAGMNANFRTIGSAIGTSVMTAIVAGSAVGGGLPSETGYDTGFATMGALALGGAAIAALVPVLLRRGARRRTAVAASDTATSLAPAADIAPETARPQPALQSTGG